MTASTIAICASQPHVADVVGALADADSSLRVLHEQARPLLVLLRGERPVLTIEAPTLVQVTGEASRLFGPAMRVADEPAWWVTCHHAASDDHAAVLAVAVADRLAAECAGVSWQSR